MYTPGFNPPDIGFDGPIVEIESLDISTLYLLARRAPAIVYGLQDSQRQKLREFMVKKIKDRGATNKLLLKMLTKNVLSAEIILKRVTIPLVELIGEIALKGLIADKSIGRDELAKKLQNMIFSEKSSFAQSGIFVSGAAEKVASRFTVFHNEVELRDARVDVVVACAIDMVEHSFLPSLVLNIQSKVGRLLVPRKQVDGLALGEANKVGRFAEPGSENCELEVTIGDSKLRYPEPKFDDTGALIIALCPTEIKHKTTGEWTGAQKIKAYDIQEEIVMEVVRGGSRGALHRRNARPIPQSRALESGEIAIFEIPIDIGPYDADIGVVCVGPDGTDLEVIHFPATYLDAVRTYSDGENRVQVEIKNVGIKSVPLKDVHFRVWLYETDKKTRHKWELRRALQDAEQKGFYAVEHLIYSKVLKGDEAGSLEGHMSALGDLANIDNLFGGEQGMIFYQHEEKGTKTERFETIECLLDKLVTEPVLTLSATGYQKELISTLRHACSVGREKRVILVCRNDIDPEELAIIVKAKRVTDILSVPGQNCIPKPNDALVKLCNAEKIKLTSLEMTDSDETPYDLVGAKRSNM